MVLTGVGALQEAEIILTGVGTLQKMGANKSGGAQTPMCPTIVGQAALALVGFLGTALNAAPSIPYADPAPAAPHLG
jgi:hypothetical protein